MAGSARLPTITGWTNSTATCWASVLARRSRTHQLSALVEPHRHGVAGRGDRPGLLGEVADRRGPQLEQLLGPVLRGVGRAGSRGGRPSSRRRSREVDVDVDLDGVAHLERAEKPAVRLDPVLGLHHGAGGVVAAGPVLLTCSRSGRAAPARVNVPVIRPPPSASGLKSVAVKVASGWRSAARVFRGGHRDLPPVPVGQRLEPAGALAHDQRVQVDPRVQAGRAQVVAEAQYAGPPATSMVRSWPACAARPSRNVCRTIRPRSVPSSWRPACTAMGAP